MFRSILATTAKVGLAIGICQAAGLIGVATSGDMERYYRRLKKPPAAPPSKVFGPVWTTLYVMMGIALYVVWRRFRETGEGKGALALFGLQLGLNAMWTPVFFGLRSPGAGLVVILLLDLALIATVVAVLAISPVAALLLAPYLLWTLFASYLNAGVWWKN